MASYNSKPNEFAPFVPEVNPEQYGQMLSLKEQRYQQGIQRVESTRASIASLPIANYEARHYAQQKMDAITSELNRNIGTDWSDAGIANLTSKHISAIANDPTIQTAIQGAMTIERGFSDLEDDTTTSKGKNFFNKQDYMDKYHAYLNAPANTPFQDEYFGHQDVLGDFEKYYKDKHPDSKIDIRTAGYQYDNNGNIVRDKTGNPVFNPGLAGKQWDDITKTYKEITPLEVHTDFQNFIKVNPLYQKQLDINGKYTYAQLQPNDVLKEAVGVITKSLKLNQQNLTQIESELGKMSADDPRRPDYEKTKTYLVSQVENNKAELSPESIYTKAAKINNPDFFNAYKSDLYKQDLYNTVMSKYAYHEDIALNFHGQSPSQKEQYRTDLSLRKDAEDIKREYLKIAQQREVDRKLAAEQKQKAVYSFNGVSTEGADTKETKSHWDNISDQYKTMRADVESSKWGYIYNKWGEAYPDKFTFGSDNKPYPKEKEREFLLNLYDQTHAAYMGAGTTDKGEKIEIGREDISHFNNLEAKNRLSLAVGDKLKEASTYLDNKIKNELDMTKNPVTVSINLDDNGRKIEHTITNQDIRQYIEQLNAEKKDPKLRHVPSPVEYSDELTALIKKDYDKDAILSGYVKANNYLVNKQFIPWVNPATKKSDDAIIKAAVPYLRGKKSTLLSNNGFVNIGYVQDPASGEYDMVIKGSTGHEDEHYPISKTEAKSLGFADVQTEDNLSQLLRVNKNRAGTGSSTFIKNVPYSHSFRDAIPLNNNVRYHVKESDGVYYLEFWTNDPKNPSGNGTRVRGKDGKPIEASSGSLTDIKMKLDNFMNTGSTQTPGYYHTTDNDNTDLAIQTAINE